MGSYCWRAFDVGLADRTARIVRGIGTWLDAPSTDRARETLNHRIGTSDFLNQHILKIIKYWFNVMLRFLEFCTVKLRTAGPAHVGVVFHVAEIGLRLMARKNPSVLLFDSGRIRASKHVCIWYTPCLASSLCCGSDTFLRVLLLVSSCRVLLSTLNECTAWRWYNTDFSFGQEKFRQQCRRGEWLVGVGHRRCSDVGVVSL